jgi:hypothetical protein
VIRRPTTTGQPGKIRTPRGRIHSVRFVQFFIITSHYSGGHSLPSATFRRPPENSVAQLFGPAIPSRRGRGDIPSWEAEQYLRPATLGYSTSPGLQYSAVFGTFRSRIIVTTSAVRGLCQKVALAVPFFRPPTKLLLTLPKITRTSRLGHTLIAAWSGRSELSYRCFCTARRRGGPLR